MIVQSNGDICSTSKPHKTNSIHLHCYEDRHLKKSRQLKQKLFARPDTTWGNTETSVVCVCVFVCVCNLRMLTLSYHPSIMNFLSLFSENRKHIAFPAKQVYPYCSVRQPEWSPPTGSVRYTVMVSFSFDLPLDPWGPPFTCWVSVSRAATELHTWFVCL